MCLITCVYYKTTVWNKKGHIVVWGPWQKGQGENKTSWILQNHLEFESICRNLKSGSHIPGERPYIPSVRTPYPICEGQLVDESFFNHLAPWRIQWCPSSRAHLVQKWWYLEFQLHFQKVLIDRNVQRESTVTAFDGIIAVGIPRYDVKPDGMM